MNIIDLNELAAKIATDLDRATQAADQGRRGTTPPAGGEAHKPPTPGARAGGEAAESVDAESVDAESVAAEAAAVRAAAVVVEEGDPSEALPDGGVDETEADGSAAAATTDDAEPSASEGEDANVLVLPTLARIEAGTRIGDVIEHTLITPDATRRDIERLCDEAQEHRFAAVCVNPAWVSVCAMRLRGSSVGTVAMVGFPLGANRYETKASEAALATQQGATEIDVVASIGKIRSGEWAYIADEIAAVVEAVSGTPVTVALDAPLLTPLELIRVTLIARESGARGVRATSGYPGYVGALGGTVTAPSAEAVAVMRLAAGGRVRVKVSGGVRDCATALLLLASGATRIATAEGAPIAACLGADERPLAELLEAPEEHGASCATL